MKKDTLEVWKAKAIHLQSIYLSMDTLRHDCKIAFGENFYMSFEGEPTIVVVQPAHVVNAEEFHPVRDCVFYKPVKEKLVKINTENRRLE